MAFQFGLFPGTLSNFIRNVAGSLLHALSAGDMC